MDYYGLFIPENFINDTIVTYTKLVESFQITGQCLKTKRIQVAASQLMR